MQWKRSDVQVADNVRLAVFEGGSASAPPLVMVHGLGHWSQAAWDVVAAELASEFRLVAFDLPGFGESSKPNARYDLAFFTQALAALCERLRIEPFALVGHSLGGLVAASYAAQQPERVTCLVLIDPAGFRRSARFLLRAVGSVPASWFFRVRPSRRFVRQTLVHATLDAASTPDAVFERAFRLAQDPAYLRAFSRVYRSAMREFVDLRGLHGRLSRYGGPVSLTWGRHDRYVPIAALADALRVYPHAAVTVCEHSAHLPNVEQPAVVADAIRRAFAERSHGAPKVRP